MFERLRPQRVSPLKRGADLPASVHGPLTGLVAGTKFRATRFEMRRMRMPNVEIARPDFEVRRIRPGAPAGATFEVATETRWPTCAGTPFEYTRDAVALLVTIAAADRLHCSGDDMTREDQLALKGAFVTLGDGQRREVRGVIPNDDGSCDLIIHPPLALAAPVEAFEPLDVKGAATVIADTTLRFVPEK
jgi:hypothetical protein